MTKNKIIDVVARIVLAVGIIVGIVFTAVGSTMIINSSLKLAFFNEPRYSNLTWELENCNDINYAISPKFNYMPVEKTASDIEKDIAKLTEEEKAEKIAECKEIAQTNAEKEFVRGEGESIVDGVSSLFVGLLIWIAFGLWGKKMKFNREEELAEKQL